MREKKNKKGSSSQGSAGQQKQRIFGSRTDYHGLDPCWRFPLSRLDGSCGWDSQNGRRSPPQKERKFRQGPRTAPSRRNDARRHGRTAPSTKLSRPQGSQPSAPALRYQVSSPGRNCLITSAATVDGARDGGRHSPAAVAVPVPRDPDAGRGFFRARVRWLALVATSVLPIHGPRSCWRASPLARGPGRGDATAHHAREPGTGFSDWPMAPCGPAQLQNDSSLTTARPADASNADPAPGRAGERRRKRKASCPPLELSTRELAGSRTRPLADVPLAPSQPRRILAGERGTAGC